MAVYTFWNKQGILCEKHYQIVSNYRLYGGNRVLFRLDVYVLRQRHNKLMPLMQRKLFDVDWTDGIKLQDIAEYAPLLAETDAINTKDHRNLTDREHEIFALLLKGVSPKEIGYALKISFSTVRFHKKNMYQKLGIKSIQELYAKYGTRR